MGSYCIDYVYFTVDTPTQHLAALCWERAICGTGITLNHYVINGFRAGLIQRVVESLGKNGYFRNFANDWLPALIRH